MPTSRELFTKIDKVIKKEIKSGKSADKVCKSPKVKKAVKEYNTKSGFVISDHYLKRIVNNQLSPRKTKSLRKRKSSSRKSRKSRK